MRNSASNQKSAGKRKRASEAAESENGSKRGRPRLNSKDENATERRRTQIRLAQRAYRQRKETTITALQDQVAQLQSTITRMKDSMLGFSEFALSSSLPPDVARKLQQTAQQFASYASVSGATSDEESESVPNGPDILSPANAQDFSKTAINSVQANSQPQEDAAFDVVRDIGLGYTQVLEDTAATQDATGETHDPSAQNFTSSALQTTKSGVTDFSFDMPDVEQIFMGGVPGNELGAFTIPPAPLNGTYAISPIYSYSFQETSFARRLRRAALECGYHLLTTRHLHPEAFQRVFKMSLLWGSPQSMLVRFKAAIRRGVGESFEYLQVPALRLGGAGTHYSREDMSGKDLIMPPNTYNLVPIAPGSSLARLENVDDGSLFSDTLVDIAGYEGEWFDPYDVEGYLKEKGLRIDPHAFFAAGEMDGFAARQLGIAPNGYSSNPRTPSLEWSLSPSTEEPPTPNLHSVCAERYLLDTSTLVGQSEVDLSSQQMDVLNDASTDLFPGSDYPSAEADSINPGLTDPLVVPANDAGKPFVDESLPLNSYLDLFPGGNLSPETVKMFDQDSMDNMDLFPDLSSGTYDKGSDMPNELRSATAQTNDSTGVTAASSALTSPHTPNKLNVTIDITKLIEELLKSGICLGRTPGFRRKGVERALRVSCIAAF